MTKLYFGYTTMTHGIKGELKCFTDFEKKEIVLKENFPIIIEDKIYKITKVRAHKDYYLITINDLNDINLVENFRHKKIYIAKEDLKLGKDEFLIQELIGFSIIENEEELGKVKEIRYNKNGSLLSIKGNKNFFIPYQDEFIKKVDFKNKQIFTTNAKGLIL